MDEDPSMYRFHVEFGICGVASIVGVVIFDGDATAGQVDSTMKFVSACRLIAFHGEHFI